MRKFLKKVDDYLHVVFARSASSKSVRIDIEDLNGFDRQIIQKYLSGRVMGTPLALANLLDATEYIQLNQIRGDIVECGVWRGGSMLTVAEKLLRSGSLDKVIWLFDTFGGMSEPTKLDIRTGDRKAAVQMNWKADINNLNFGTGYEGGIAAAASLQDVINGFQSINFPDDKTRYIVGKVEETLIISNNLPEHISLLRLDTDWYESTKIELEVLWPRLVPGGVLVLDDYDYWEGSKKAVDEYFKHRSDKPFLIRMDHGRIAVKHF